MSKLLTEDESKKVFDAIDEVAKANPTVQTMFDNMDLSYKEGLNDAIETVKKFYIYGHTVVNGQLDGIIKALLELKNKI